MPRKSLGTLSNLSGYATHNTRRTTARKFKNKHPLSIPGAPKGKENTKQVCTFHSRKAWILCPHSPKISLRNESSRNGLGTSKIPLPTLSSIKKGRSSRSKCFKCSRLCYNSRNAKVNKFFLPNFSLMLSLGSAVGLTDLWMLIAKD